jgi:hypothetical protein
VQIIAISPTEVAGHVALNCKVVDMGKIARGGNMSFAAGLAIGLLIGVFTGVVVLSLMIISRQSEEREERMAGKS